MATDILTSRAMVWALKVQSIADQARDLTLDAAQSVGARYADESRAVDVQKLLEGRSDREKIDGMRRIIAISSKGTDMSDHFASVVKNVASSNLELRKLVYIYIARYAESQPDLALLSINTIQKALSDQNQIVRALALRLISSIRVVSISGIVLLSIKKCMSDSSEYVRKTAAMSIAKTNMLDRSLYPQLVECLKVMLTDDSPNVLAAAIEAHESICPAEVDLLHPIYRRACACLDRMDDFAQVNVLRHLERYARLCFTDPAESTSHTQAKDFYEDTNGISHDNSDFHLLLKNAAMLLRSRNSATVIAACRLLSRSGYSSEAKKVVEPLVSLLRKSADLSYVVLCAIVASALNTPSLWSRLARHFLVHPSDSTYIWTLKLEILTLIVDSENAELIVSEMAQYSYDVWDETFAKAAIQAICKCAQHTPDIATKCISILFEHMQSENSALTGEAVVSLRQLIQLNPNLHVQTIKSLARSLDTITAPVARASIFWLVCENLQLIPQIAPDVLRVGVRDFARESEEVRIQILSLAVKMYVVHSQHTNQEDVREVNTAIQAAEEAQIATEREETIDDAETNGEVKQDITTGTPASNTDTLLDVDTPIPKMYAHVCQLARYDLSYDIRDRLRTYKILVSSPDWVLTQRLLFCPKPTPVPQSPFADSLKYNPGSSSMLVGLPVTGYQDLPKWADKIIGAAERNVEAKTYVAKSLNHKSTNVVQTPSSFATPFRQDSAKPKSKLTGISSLDDFYATSSEDEEQEEEEEEEEEEDTHDTTSDESETDDEDTTDEEPDEEEETSGSEEDTGSDTYATDSLTEETKTRLLSPTKH